MDTMFSLSTCLTLLLVGTLVSTEDHQGSVPSAEALRRYLSLYEQRAQLERLKPDLLAPDNQDAVVADEEPSGSTYYRSPGQVLNRPPPYKQDSPTRWSGRGQPEFWDEPLPSLPDDTGQGMTSKLTTGDAELWATTQERQRTPDDQQHQQQQQQQMKKSEQRTSQADPEHLPLSQPRTGAQSKENNPLNDVYFVIIVAGCSAAAIFGVIAAGYCFYRFQKNSKAAAEVDYPAYGVTGPNKDQTSPNGDRRLAQSAQMYHYQHQKQQMIAVEKATTARNTSASDIDSEEENEEGDYTVYECPGLAPTGEMEVKNPLFQDDSTPMSPPVAATKDSKKP